MSRSRKKGPFIDAKLLDKVLRAKKQGSYDPIKTWSRASTILPEFVGHTFLVHNGRSFLKVYVVENMVGHKLGEFSLTRIFRGHPGQRVTDEKEGSAPKPAAAAGKGS